MRDSILVDYQGLAAWQRAMDLCSEIYRVTDSFPKRETFGLSRELRRSAVSVPSNIAEGEGRAGVGERKQFLSHARGSLYELETQLMLAKRAGFLADEAPFTLIAQTKLALEGYIAYVSRR